MEVHLTPDHEAFIQSAVRDGRFRSSDEAMREAVNLLAQHERETASLRALVGKGVADIKAGDFEDFTDDSLPTLFDGVRTRGRARLSAQPRP